MSNLIEKIAPLIEETVERLNSKEFRRDPIGGEHFSKIVSVMSSAYKRHGFILEKAILERLSENENFEVWEDRAFAVNSVADHLVDASIDAPEELINTLTSYSADASKRTLQIDTIVYDKINKTLSCYEIKRGNGLHDAGKRRSILRDLLCAQVLLKSYGEQRGLEVVSARSRIIFYYGQCSIRKPFSLTKDELDEHFNFEVMKHVEEANEFFRKRLYDLLTK